MPRHVFTRLPLPHAPCSSLKRPQYEDAAAAEQHAAAEAAGLGPDGQPLPQDPAELRQHLKMADIARRQAEEDLPYEEIPQPDEDGDGM